MARTLALILVCSLGGAGVVVASGRLQTARERELLLERNRVEYALSEAQLERATADLERFETLYREGVTNQTRVADARLEVGLAEVRVRRLTLDREEILATGRAPALEITAPLAAGRDMVSERVRLDRATAELFFESANERLVIAEKRFAAGMIPVGEVGAVRAELDKASVELGAHDARLSLRAAWLNGTLTSAEALRADRLASVDLELAIVGREIELLEEELAIAIQRQSMGVAPEGERKAIEASIEELRTESELLRLERELIVELTRER